MKPIRPVTLAFSLLMAFLSPALSAQPSNDDCMACHGEKGGAGPFVRKALLKSSVHANHDCIMCHTDATEIPHPGKMAPVQCSTCHAKQADSYKGSHHAKFWKDADEPGACLKCHGDGHGILSHRDLKSPIGWLRLDETCGKCHPAIAKEYAESIHGTALKSGAREAPTCTNCHGEHKILGPRDADSPVSAQRIPETCSQCHESRAITGKFDLNPSVVKTFRGGFHGLALQAGVLKSANCASCHGVHNIHPSGDKRSTVHPDNLAKTCSQCHPGVGQSVLIGKIHENPRDPQQAGVSWVRILYLWIIGLTLGFMFLHNFSDFLTKITKPWVRFLTRDFYDQERLNRNERRQHILLMVSFGILAYTGFCHTWPGAWWAKPFDFGQAGATLRRVLHMVAAGLLTALSVYHVYFMLFTPMGRNRLRDLFPRLSDALDLWTRICFTLGFAKKAPPHRRFTYIEKMEYWAMIWGTAVMGLTGLAMFYRDWWLQRFPKWLLDIFMAVHFWEAVLAVSAIVLWHFYWVIFDPEIYPMNRSWLDGKPVSKHERRPRDGE